MTFRVDLAQAELMALDNADENFSSTLDLLVNEINSLQDQIDDLENGVSNYMTEIKDGDCGEDGWGSEIVIDAKVPTGVDVVLELWLYPDDGNDWELIGVVDDGGPGRDEELIYGGGAASSDTGWYFLMVYSAEGFSCDSSYSVDIEA